MLIWIFYEKSEKIVGECCVDEILAGENFQKKALFAQ